MMETWIWLMIEYDVVYVNVFGELLLLWDGVGYLEIGMYMWRHGIYVEIDEKGIWWKVKGMVEGSCWGKEESVDCWEFVGINGKGKESVVDEGVVM